MAGFEGAIDSEAVEVLDGCHEVDSQRQGYGMGMRKMALVGLKMIVRLAGEAPRLSEVVPALLGDGDSEAAQCPGSFTYPPRRAALRDS